MTITDESAERIKLLYRAAETNGSLVTVQELFRLLPGIASKEEVKQAILSIPQLRSKFELTEDYITERNGTRLEKTFSETLSRKRARTNMATASRFVASLPPKAFELVAVSGSTSYGSASHSKDVDLFCVSAPGKMWVSLTKGLLLARAYRLVHRSSPAICFSCIMDDHHAQAVFATNVDPLFARDALEAKVLKGQDAYQSLMRSAGWISGLFPVAYRNAVSQPSEGTSRTGTSTIDRILNGFLYQIVSRYIRLKSSLLNRSLGARRREADMFDVRAAEDHLIYESKRYTDLKEDYATVMGLAGPR